MNRLASIPELYAHAIAIEREAAERYAELAERMRDESNEDLAGLFAGMAALEAGHLAPEDWKAIDAAFAADRDPIAGMQQRDFEKLFARIVSLAPDPVGLGERWQGA